MKLELYLDLETTSTENDAGIWQIGALIVTKQNRKEFLIECVPDGDVSQRTIDWIYSSSDVAQEYESAINSGITQKKAIEEFCKWTKKFGMKQNRFDETVFQWGNFDVPIVGNKLDPKDYPWHYGSICDVRSASKFINQDIRPDSTHNALEDAIELHKCVEQLRRLVK